MDASHGTEHAPDELEQLRKDYPSYSIGTVWTAAGSGPDACRYVAVKGAIVLSAWSAAALAARIRQEEQS